MPGLIAFGTGLKPPLLTGTLVFDLITNWKGGNSLLLTGSHGFDFAEGWTGKKVHLLLGTLVFDSAAAVAD